MPAPDRPAPDRPDSDRKGAAPRAANLDSLRRRIAALERFSGVGNSGDGSVAPLHVAAVDGHLPWDGIPRSALHEIAYDASFGETSHGGAAATGFAAAVLGRLAQDTRRAVVWSRRPARGFRPALYGAGLARFGLKPDQLILAQAADSQAVLWSMEECLRSRAVAAVLGEPGQADARARRRLQLAAEDTGVTAVLLLDDRASAMPGPAVTRWRISPAPNPGSHAPAWRVELLKCRGGGRPGEWVLEWHPRGGNGGDRRHENSEPAGGFRVVSPLCHGPARRRTG